MTDSNSLNRRRFLQATGAAATAMALAGCTGGGGDEETTTTGGETTDGGDTTTTEEMEAQTGGTLNLINSTMTTLDPIKATDTASGRVIRQIFDNLMIYPNGETAVVQSLAEDYTTNDDFTQYTFTLKDATYHDGSQVTAADFVYSWERLAASENSRRTYFILDSLGMVHETDSDDAYVPGSISAEATSDTELTFELEQAFASTLAMLAYTSFACIPEGIVGDIEGYDGEMEHSEFATSNPIGCGPFKFGNWDQGSNASVTRYEDYHGEKAYLDSVNWEIIEDDNAAYEWSMDKKSDFLSIPTPQYDPGLVSVDNTDDLGRDIGTYGPVRNGETVNYVRVPEISTFYFGFNTASVPKPVRQAVAYVTNQKEFAEQVFKSRVAPAYHLTPPLIYPGAGNAYNTHAEESYPYGYNQADVQGAQQVMEEAGYGEDNRYSLTFTHYTSETWSQIAEILQGRLGAAYIDLEIEQAEFAAMLERGRNGNLEAYTLGWIADWPGADNFLQLIYPPRTDTSQEGPLSYTNWSGTEASDRAEEAFQRVLDNRAPTEEAEQIRNEAYVEMEEANWEDVVFVNTFHNLRERFYYNNVHVPVFGGMGTSRQMLNRTWKEQ
ncbi:MULTISPECIES: ABC transporter substrate-binding protein [unclassified Haladaptatus]|uniref:ABC transporter substrate-binding protein n=1 Tax=unclassified Haladaptatus TaxID=2622732 RepID=UPI002FCE2614